MDGWLLGNLLIGGLIGIIIDASNGSMYKLTPDQVIAQSRRKRQRISKTERQVYCNKNS